MSGQFTFTGDVKRETLDWGILGWVSSPGSTDAKDIVVIEVLLNDGGGHNFHKHPDQEEVIYVVEGEVEQWLEQEKQILKAGDSIFIPKDIVHASFNSSGKSAKVIAILSPCVGNEPSGYEVVEVAEKAPWNTLR